MVILPRLARSLQHPMLAGLLGVILIAIGLYGIIGNHIATGWSILLIVIGAINLLRLVVRQPDATPAA